MSKDIYIEEVERIAAELEENGMEAGKAYDRASELAEFALMERLADMADDIKTRGKEGR